MLGYILKRLLYAVPVTLAVSVICFSLVQLAPGDPLTVVLPADASQAIVDQTRARYGLDKPLPVQYLLWLGNVLRGDLGTSIATGRPVASEIGHAIGYTLSVAVLACLLALVVGLALGLVAGYRMGSPADKIASATAISGVSVPHYWLGIVLVAFFSVKLGWFPAMGAGRSGQSLGDALSFMILPVLTMAAMPAGIITRSVRALVAEKLGQEFVTALRAKGLTRPQIFAHVVKNAAPTALAVIGVQMGYLMAGSILVETVFAWPGTGLLLNNAILTRDIPLLQGTILVLALIFVVLNLIVDILQPLFDPRIQRT
ncbi:ABC transporter permease [Sinirhodobacter huangdaonensis]|uniref:ABC transporter permease n=1 Tax=Paenirhodobacter huangdaonensis TaxID=2501515 RepID=A0A443LSV4_9RHOB|nr:ABC transporter permease [Sinirhodobacter huangdaonensis]RWR52210.1 ABC transporter permease [Sinirhodobacter huangdaonensis]